ncbi:unnamed protein product [Sphenostylis stenocarpa]|uniref:Uncharacterized protein n=1 Tax=Sphenostylis stenocarpa TaxID=92480 RepID=A0AA86W357_9FABA|nr:unnamed protein product [Sphenostylis stenocarpa]
MNDEWNERKKKISVRVVSLSAAMLMNGEIIIFIEMCLGCGVCNSGEKAKGDDERESTTVKDRFEDVLDTHDDDDHESWTKSSFIFSSRNFAPLSSHYFPFYYSIPSFSNYPPTLAFSFH